jgi:hypothetical protein
MPAVVSQDVVERAADAVDVLVIRDLASLAAWRRRLRDVITPRRLPVVDFRLASLAPEQNRSYSLIAAGYRRACGCATSGLFMATAVIAIAAYFAGRGLAGTGVRHAAACLGIVVGAALAGKLSGLAWARWRLWRLAATVDHAIRRAPAT